jgi:CRP-like cAMP-binding protein
MLDDVLALTEGLPTRTLATDDLLFAEGEASSTVVVLVDGDLVIDTGGVVVNRLTAPGSFVGEIGALLGQQRSATVIAKAPTVIREIGDPREFFATYPHLGLEMARQLAGRLFRLTAYIADVQHQLGDRDDHMGMFGELLSRIATRAPIDIEPGSDRSPDY